MSDFDLKAAFENSTAPKPRPDLASRIMAAATAQSAAHPAAAPIAANDNSWLKWAAGIAAAFVLGFVVWTAQPSEDDVWDDYAAAAGFEELMAWVEADVS